MSRIAGFMPVLKRQLEAGGTGLEGYWTASEIEAACREQHHVWRDRFWTPLRTISTFLLQALHAGSSCREAVALTLAQNAADGRPLASGDASAYCQARLRLPLKVLKSGLSRIGERLRDEVASKLTWCGRRVWLVDGTSCSMPDTPELQKTFGQPSGQAKGCGFPVAKVVGLFCWASGAVLETAVGPWRMSELALWRTLWRRLSPGEIVLGDRFYCTFYDFVGVMRRGCDAVFRLHARRPSDLRRGHRLGARDRLVVWQRPTWTLRPRGMCWREWESLPQTLTLRLLRFSVDIPGFRSRSITVATTLLDPVTYPASQIAALYRDRWLIELRFRDIKTTLGMDVLRGKSADVVHKEILVHLMAYNLIRALMWQAAARHGVALHRMSFAGAVDRLNSVMPYLWLLEGSSKAKRLYELLLQWIAGDALPDRPNRLEPRVVKRRPKQYTLMKRPRQQLRRILLSRRVSYA
jgi:hypothetical protein